MIEAAGIIYKHQGDILLVKRAAGGDMPETWAFPGGKVDGDESHVEAAVRESQEEVGHTPDNLELFDRQETNGVNFVTFLCELPEKFIPTLNDEHTDFVWTSPMNLPANMHPGAQLTLSLLTTGAAMDESARAVDINGFIEIEDNPISKVGVFPYSGASIGAPDPTKMYMVYRPAEELSSQECIDSFKLVPIIDEHTMLGEEEGMMPAEQKGVHGTTGENVRFIGGVLMSNIKIFSSSLKATIDNMLSPKKDISLGYRCVYDFTGGIFGGVKYDAVQRCIRGNHLAIVKEGRMGPDVAVLDHMKFTIDSQELTKMASKELKAKLDGAKKQVAELEKAFDEAEQAGTGGLAELAGKIDTIMTILGELKDMEAKEAEAAAKAKGADADPDADKDKPDDKAADADPDADKDDDKKGMDAAEVSKLIQEDRKAFLKELNQKNQLAEQLSNHVGSFDHAEMTLADVEKYGAEKLGLKVEAGKEGAAVAGYLSAAKVSKPAFVVDGAHKSDASKPSAIRNHVSA